MRSMTGFASADGVVAPADDAASATPVVWRWDAKSVNGRGLEARMRLPSGWEAQEGAWRARVAERFKRGSISLTLSVSEASAMRPLKVNAEVLEQVIAAAATVREAVKSRGGPEPSLSIDGLLGLRGVLETDAPEAGASGPSEAAVAAASAGFEAALDGLAAARAEEGARLKATLSSQIDQIETLTDRAETEAAARGDVVKERLRERVAALLEAGPELDPARLAQEAALIAVKADVREEIDRLRSHVAGARALLADTAPVGRKLDFLTQEFNREANTLCSKSQDAALTETGLQLKVVIDQLREQASNVE